MNTKTQKLIVVIEIEMERPVTDIGNEVCRRITMHPHVKDSNLISISESLAHLHAPKPVNVTIHNNTFDPTYDK